jgi:hypothetical protein
MEWHIEIIVPRKADKVASERLITSKVLVPLEVARDKSTHWILRPIFIGPNTDVNVAFTPH